MIKRASPTVIGTFVIVSVALVLVALAVLGSRWGPRNRARLLVYFDTAVGLRVGAPVKFRGIDIGTVQDIRISLPGAARDPTRMRIPVVLEIDEDRLTAGGVSIDLRDRAQVQRLVDQGLRAELATESAITLASGAHYVALDIKPDTPAQLVSRSARYPEIPSVHGAEQEATTKIDKLLDNLAEVDLAKLTRSIETTADDAHKLLGSPHLARAVSQVDELTANLNRTVTNLNKVVSGLEQTTRELTAVGKSAGHLLAPDGTLSAQIDSTLKEIAASANSIRRLTDQLSRDPGSILRGGRP